MKLITHRELYNLILFFKFFVKKFGNYSKSLQGLAIDSSKILVNFVTTPLNILKKKSLT